MKRVLAIAPATALAALGMLVSLSGTALAHPGHGHETAATPAIPSVTFLAGLSVLIGSVFADHRGLVDRWVADAGVVIGILATLTGITWFWI